MPPTVAPCDLAYTTALVAACQRIWAAPDIAALWPTVVDEALALIAADWAAVVTYTGRLLANPRRTPKRTRRPMIRRQLR